MKNQPVLLILSDRGDFIEPVASLVTRELGLNCKSISNEVEIKGAGQVIVVSDHKLMGNYDLPVIVANLPIRIRSLFGQIEAARASLEETNSLAITAELSLSLQHKALSNLQGISTTLTDKESRLLQMITEAGETGISKETLLKEVWNIDAVLDTHTLETHIYRLRKKIKDAFGDEMIKANDGGYRI